MSTATKPENQAEVDAEPWTGPDRPKTWWPEDPQAVAINLTNVNCKTSPRALYSGTVLDQTVGQVIRNIENAGCFILSIAFNGGVLDVRLLAHNDGWHTRMREEVQKRMQQRS